MTLPVNWALAYHGIERKPARENMSLKQYDETAKGPLDGVRVLDMTRLVAGNMLTLQLADFGADVVKLEMLPKGDPLRAWKSSDVATSWKVYGRNKKSVTLNFREPEGLDILLRLVETADCFVENMRPGRLEEMGIGPDVLLARNPNLIVTRVTGFGQTGPYSSHGGFGTVVEAMSGFAALNGFADRVPVLPPLALADMVAGLYGAMANLIALREREVKGGKGQVIDLSLLEPVFSILGAQAAAYKVTGKVPQRVGSGSNTTSPRNAYRTSDGKYVALSGSIQTMAERLFRVIGRDDMNHDPKFRTNADRIAHREEVDAIVGGWIGERPQAEVLEIFRREGITGGPIYDISDIVEDAHFQEREIIVDLPDDEMGRVPMHNIIPLLSGTPGVFRRPAPEMGAHNAEILAEIGIDAAALADLTDRGIV